MFDGMVLREARRTAELTQPQLAELVGCDKNTISRYELGHFRPSSAVARKLAKVLGVDVKGLHAPADVAEDQPLLTEQERQIVAALRYIPPYLRTKLAELITALAGGSAASSGPGVAARPLVGMATDDEVQTAKRAAQRKRAARQRKPRA